MDKKEQITKLIADWAKPEILQDNYGNDYGQWAEDLVYTMENELGYYLKSQLTRIMYLTEALQFYADKNNWQLYKDDYYTCIEEEDEERVFVDTKGYDQSIWVGGLIARKALNRE